MGRSGIGHFVAAKSGFHSVADDLTRRNRLKFPQISLGSNCLLLSDLIEKDLFFPFDSQNPTYSRHRRST
jgi:hypothetical protein